MAHLVDEIRNVSLRECYDRLTDCLDFLVEVGSETAKRAANVKADHEWGVRTKRTVVHLSPETPLGIGQPDSKQSLTEVINQTANISRLLDALTWAMSDQSGLDQHRVVVCHPTTSSGVDESDLVLGRSGFKSARFEVTDVVGNKDGNKKEVTDLKSLKFVSAKTKRENVPVSAPKYRGFLVMSQELGDVICNRKSWWSWGDSAVVLLEPKENRTSTLIFEVTSIPEGSNT